VRCVARRRVSLPNEKQPNPYAKKHARKRYFSSIKNPSIKFEELCRWVVVRKQARLFFMR
jgi:hypothetical protein